ncbi:hypothetical protein [Carboxylicivirga sp. RSCT41]|uniref:hypothetical protein n=1 Tax=Carboxylicivirga agarovorans TaxID=3417570 RepID=UPI003D3559AD
MFLDIFKHLSDKAKEKRGKGVFLLLLLLFFLTDTLNVVIPGLSDGKFGYTSPYTMLSSISKGAFLMCYCIYALLFHTKKFLIVTGTLLIFFITAYFTYPEEDFYFYFTWIIRPAKLILPFILFDIIKHVRIESVNKVFNVFAALIALQSVVVIIAFLFGIDFFLTYGDNRFGYIGLIEARNEATFYYAIAVIFLLRQWQVKKTKLHLILMSLALIASALLGTKAVFILHASLMIYMALSQNKFNKLVLLSVLFVLGSILLYSFYYFGAFDFFIEYLHQSDWLTMITSFRNLLIQERLPVVFSKWEWYNYLFGGINPTNSYVEMDIIDLFTFSGLVGSIIFYWMLFKSLFKFSKKNYLGWFLVSQYIIIGGLAGHVFASGINAIYLALTCYYLQQTEMNLKECKEERG